MVSVELEDKAPESENEDQMKQCKSGCRRRTCVVCSVKHNNDMQAVHKKLFVAFKFD